MDMDTRFIYIGENTAIRISSIQAVSIRRNSFDNNGLNIFTGPGEDDYFILDAKDFNKIFDTNYDMEYINDHLLEMFLCQIDEGVVNRPKYNAEKAVGGGLKCPVCGKVSTDYGPGSGIKHCNRCGVAVDFGTK